VVARKPRLDVCFFCDTSPCTCAKPVKKSQPATVETQAPVVEEPVFTKEQPRVVRKVSSPPPAGVVIPVASPLTSTPPLTIVPPVVRKVERRLTDDEILEIAAIQVFAKVGLISTTDNPQLADLITMRLTPQERAVAWRARL